MKKNVNLSRIVATILTLFMVWGGVTGCNQQPPATNTFTITFDSNGGSEVPAITKEEGAVVEAPSAPTKTGYTFVEWQKEDGTAYDWTAPLTASITLKAKWDPVSYTITYLPEGVETDNPTTYTIEDETITLKDPTKGPDATKTNFVGWYEDEACTIAATGIEKGSTGDKTFYAKYTDKVVYTVKFILDGKDFGKAQKVEEGKTVTAIEGYDMCSDKELTKAFDIKTEIKAETTIYLKVKEFTVTFNSDGGSAVAAAKVKYNETVKEPAAPTKEGFNFDGWYNGDTKFDFTTKITKDLTLKAQWKAAEAELEAKWPNALPTGKGAPFIVNSDGTVSSTFTAAYNGNGIVVYINKDKSAVAAGSTVKVTFDYKTTTWKDETIKPKFKVALCTAAEDYWSYTNCTEGSESFVEYWNAENLEGSMTLSRTASADADMLAIQFNANEWTDGADTDSIDIKLKSVEVIVPDENARKWESSLPSGKGASMTDNGDGTLSSTFTAAYNGNGIVVYINEDKSAVATGSTVKVTFDYKTTTWKDETIKPKFKVALCTAAEDYWNYTNCTEGSESFVEYWNAENLEGSMTLSRTASADADMLAIQFNANEWTGADTDSIDIKLKSVEIE